MAVGSDDAMTAERALTLRFRPQLIMPTGNTGHTDCRLEKSSSWLTITPSQCNHNSFFRTQNNSSNESRWRPRD